MKSWFRCREQFADGCIHALGVPASVVAMAALLVIAIQAEPSQAFVSSAVYGLGLVATFSCSAAYNLIDRPSWRDVLRRLDHSAIYLMIAGTYTPIALMTMRGAWGYGLLATVWAITALGIALQVLAPGRLKRLSLPLYLVQGWAIVAALEPLSASVPQRVLVLLMLGGALYSIGVLFHMWQRLPYQNAIWHAFVLVAAACHYVAIVDVVRAAA